MTSFYPQGNSFPLLYVFERHKLNKIRRKWNEITEKRAVVVNEWLQCSNIPNLSS
jgi:hypothetical protein